MKKLFVAFSHTLSPSQEEGWDEIIMLRKVNEKLQDQMSQIPASSTIEEVRELARKIVHEAIKAEATHFYCVGEPSLTFWANFYAGISHWGNKMVRINSQDTYSELDGMLLSRELICVQSTTERVSVETTQPDGSVVKTAVFKHVQWRELF